MISNKAVIQEIMTMLGINWSNAREIFRHAATPPGTIKRVKNRGGLLACKKRDMFSEEAKRIVDAARNRIELIDEGD